MKSFCIFLLLGIHFLVAAQKADTTIYTSSFEQNLFSGIRKNLPVRPFDLLIAFQYTSNSAGFEKAINSFNAELEAKGFHKLNRKKQLKLIYEKVHNRFFKKYSEEAYFNDIFQNGNYNCVTASALYALILDYFKIDYVIKETPNHVFIVADPNSTSYLFETTLPSKGAVEFDERFKKDYIDYLRSNKIISEVEYKTNSFDDLFQKHYESSKTINSIQLAALQYYNKGVFSFEARDFLNAANYFEKAAMIYPSTGNQFFYSSALQNLLAEEAGRKKYQGKTLAKYLNHNYSNHESRQLTLDHFKAITNEMVINRPDLKGYSAFFDDFSANIRDTVDIKDFRQVYHESLAYYYYLKHDHQHVFYNASRAYEINPENLRNRQFVLEALINYFREGDKMDEITPDSLVNYAFKFPFLVENDFYRKMLAYGFTSDIQKGGIQLGTEDLKANTKNLEKFSKKLLAKNISEETVEKLYSESAAALVRDYNYDGAEIVLKNGLEWMPDSEQLAQQLATISKSKADLKKYMKSTYVQVPTSLLITPPKYNDTEVYASVRKYMTRCWKVDFFRKDGKTKDTKVEELNFIFMPNNKMKFKTGTEEHWGTWKLVESGPTLTLQSNEDKQQLIILIYEASATQMRGILSPYKAENKKIEFNACGN